MRSREASDVKKGSDVLPTFFVIGAMKAGTSSLWMYLFQHPSVYLPRKEPNFFSSKWDMGLDWYGSLYPEVDGVSARGDISPSYALEPGGAAARIASLVPSARLIYLLRHPIQRIQAHYLHDVAARRERRPIEEAVALSTRFVTASSYAKWIDGYLEHFDRSQLLLIKTEDMRDRREVVLDRVLTHIGLQPGWRPGNLAKEYHRTGDKRIPRPGVKLLRKLPGARFVAGSKLTRGLSRPIDTTTASVSPELEGKLRTALAPDLERLRGYMEPGFDPWGLL